LVYFPKVDFICHGEPPGFTEFSFLVNFEVIVEEKVVVDIWFDASEYSEGDSPQSDSGNDSQTTQTGDKGAEPLICLREFQDLSVWENDS